MLFCVLLVTYEVTAQSNVDPEQKFDKTNIVKPSLR